MANTNSPFGFRAVRHINNSSITQNGSFTIASGYATNIPQGAPVIMSGSQSGANNVLALAVGAEGTASTALVGVFAGCSYTDAQGRPHYSNFWPASTVATNIIAYVYTDPGIVFAVQCDATQPTIGSRYDANMAADTAGVNGYGISQAYLVTSSAGSTKGFLVERVTPDQNNALGAYQVVEVTMANNIRKG
jgi:hypothetical protein